MKRTTLEFEKNFIKIEERKEEYEEENQLLEEDEIEKVSR